MSIPSFQCLIYPCKNPMHNTPESPQVLNCHPIVTTATLLLKLGFLIFGTTENVLVKIQLVSSRKEGLIPGG